MRSGLRGRGWRWVEKNVWRRATLVTVALALLTVLITTAITVAQLSDLPLKVRTAEVDLRNEKRLQVRFSFRSEPLAPPPAPLKASHVSHVSDRRWKADTPYPRLGRGRHPSLYHMSPQDWFLIARALFCGVELLATRHARSFKLDDGSPRWTQMAVDFEVQSPALVVHSLSVDDITCELALMDADTPQPFGVLKSDGGIGVTSGTQRCSTRLVDVRPPFSLASHPSRQRSTLNLHTRTHIHPSYPQANVTLLATLLSGRISSPEVVMDCKSNVRLMAWHLIPINRRLSSKLVFGGATTDDEVRAAFHSSSLPVLNPVATHTCVGIPTTPVFWGAGRP